MPEVPIPAQPAAAAGTAYDAVAYPSTLFTQTAPDRLAVVARLAGLSPPPIATARMLEIACGDGMNLIALAVAWPDAEFVGFDLAASAIERGRDWIAQCGLTNVRLEVMDIADAAEQLGGTFDYVIAHGLYAWVPPEVRDASMRLIGDVLTENGVAYVSYNALPGGYFRMAVRDALLFAIADVEGDDERVAAAQANLKALAQPMADESTAQIAVRHAAEVSLGQAAAVLRHDELGDHYYPQSLTAVVTAAQGVGLRFLGDAVIGSLHHIFLPDDIVPDADDVETQLVHIRQAEDYRLVRFFRSTLLIRDTRRPVRRLDRAAMRGLYATTRCSQVDATNFAHANGEFEVSDAALAMVLSRLVEAWPARIQVAELEPGDALCTALFEMFDAGFVDLHTTDAPYAVSAPERPRISALNHLLIAADTPALPTLDHRLVSLPDAGMRAFLALLDGTRTVEDLLPAGQAIGIVDATMLERVLKSAARKGILLP